LGNHSLPAPPGAVCRRTVPARAALSRRHTQARAAPFTSYIDRPETTRSAPERVGQFRSGGTSPPCSAKTSQDAMSLAQAAPSPFPPAASVLRAGARAARARAHMPTAHWSVHPPRLTPRTAAPTLEQPCQAAGTRRHAPHLSPAARITRNRSGACETCAPFV